LDWEKVGPDIRFNPSAQVEIEEACYPILTSLASFTAAECIDAVYALLDPAFVMTNN
jgi:hypothetical protein